MLLERLARTCFRRRRTVLALWIAAVTGFVFLAGAFGGTFSNEFKLPGSESQRAFDRLQDRFPTRAGDEATIVFAAADVDDPAVRARMEAVFAQVERADHVVSVESPYDAGPAQISRDGTVAFATVRFDDIGPQIPRDLIFELTDQIRAAEQPGLQVEFGGNLVQFAEEQEFGGAREGIGLLAAVVILLLTFGSVIAMGLPILIALTGIAIGMAFVLFLMQVMDVPVFAPQLAIMIGLGVGIDYALLIVTRYRQALHGGTSPEDATALAISTAGRAVIFAGLTVVISLMGMFTMGLNFVHGLAVSAGLVVLMVMLGSITLLPAILGFAGRSIDRWRIALLHRDETQHRASFWYRWSRVVQRRPLVSLLAGTAILVPLVIPVFALRLGVADTGNNATTKTTRRAYDLLAQGFGPGFNGPFVIVADIEGPGDLQAIAGLAEHLRGVDGVAAVLPPRPNSEGDTAVVTLFPGTGPQDEQTDLLLDRLRQREIPTGLAGADVEVAVGGLTPIFVDLSRFLGSRLPLFIGVVIGLSFLLLMMVFRSLLVPLKAAVMNVASIAAAYGLLVAVFQWGWGLGIIGLDRTGPIESFAPMMLFAILFGLSMDYEVFLLSRMREEYVRTRDNATAVADGLAATARVITAAAAIMVTLFLSFVLGDQRIIKLVGLGLASAIFIDATIVRMVLVPSTMELLGRANWWLPRWLDRILPRVSIEAPAEQEPTPQPVAGGSD